MTLAPASASPVEEDCADDARVSDDSDSSYGAEDYRNDDTGDRIETLKIVDVESAVVVVAATAAGGVISVEGIHG